MTPPRLKHVQQTFSHACLQNITEVGVLPVSQILKGVDHAVVGSFSDTGGGQLVASLVLAAEVPAEEDEDDDEEGVAAEVGGEGGVVRGSFPGLLVG